MFPYVVLVGVAVQLAGIYSYAKSTLQGITKPNRVTWLMWSIAPLIATSASIASGVTWAAVPVFMSGFGPLLIFLISFVNRQSYWQLTRFDYLCGIFSGLALILWAITKIPDVAILFAIVSDGSAAVPTLVKGWRHPETESLAPYSTGFINALTSFFAITIWSFASLAFPVYLVLMNLLLMIAVTRKRAGIS